MNRRKKILVSIIFMLAVLMFSAFSSQAATRRFLAIGQTYPGTDSALPDCAKDAQAMARIAQKTGYAKVTTKYNLKYNDIISAIKTAFSGATDSDVSFFYYSGHGSSDGSIISNEFYGMSPSDLASQLKQIKGTIIVMADSCYSGNFIGKSASATSAAAAFVSAFKTNDVVKAGPMCTSKFQVITASRRDQYSWCGSGYSVFTKALADGAGYNYSTGTKLSTAPADANKDGKLSTSELGNYTYKILAPQTFGNNREHQYPQYYPTNSTFPVYYRNPTPSVSLNQTSLSLYAGQTAQLKVNGSSSVKWSTSNSAVAAVSSSGKVYTKAKGTCNIYAKVGTKTLTCKVTVAAMALNRTSLTLYTGASYTLKVNGGSGSIIWYSNNKSVAAVSTSGKVYAKKAGTAVISVKRNGKIMKCSVTVKNKVNQVSYNVDLNGRNYPYYEEPIERIVKVWYSGSDLYANIAVINCRMFRADYFSWWKIKLYKSNGALLASKNLGRTNLYIAPYGAKVITVKFSGSEVADRSYSLSNGVSLWDDWYYYYSY